MFFLNGMNKKVCMHRTLADVKLQPVDLSSWTENILSPTSLKEKKKHRKFSFERAS